MAKSIRFKVGMQVKVNSDKTGVGVSNKTVADMGFKNGETVELIHYDSSDETWHVKSAGKWMWIKRKNLAPIEAEPTANPFKVGDKVQLINERADWASSDNVTTGVEYTVTEVYGPAHNQKDPVIRVSGGRARGLYWIKSADFKLSVPKKVAKKKAEPKTMRALCLDSRLYEDSLIEGKVYTVREDEPVGKDKFYEVLDTEDGVICRCWQSRFKIVKEEPVNLTNTRGWAVGDTLSMELLNDGKRRNYYGFSSDCGKWTPRVSNGFYGSEVRTIEEIKVVEGRLAARISDTSDIWVDIKSLPVKAEPKPVETPKKEVVKMKCVDADGWRGYLTLGKTYEVELDPKDSGSVRVISPDNPYSISGDGSMRLFKNRFELIETPKPVVKEQPQEETFEMECVDSSGWRGYITAGKVYKMGVDPESDYYYKLFNPDKPWRGNSEGVIYLTKTRFKQVEAPKRRMALYVDTSDSYAHYVVGKVYEIWKEDSTFYYLAEMDGKRYEGGMFKHRFKEIVDEQVPAPVTVTAAAPYEFLVGDKVRLTRKKSSYYSLSEQWINNLDMKEGRSYTVTAANVINGDKYINVNNTTINLPVDCFELEKSPQWVKEMECIHPNKQNMCSVEEGRKYFVAMYDHDDTIVMVLNPSGERPGRFTEEIKGYVRNYGNDAAMFLGRFKEIAAPPRVGDTITADWLNSDTPKAFHGYVNGWRTEVVRCFGGDRKIQKIENKDGRMAALISGTCNIWIDLAELTGEKSTVDKTFTVTVSKDKLAAFNKEVQALVAKYK